MKILSITPADGWFVYVKFHLSADLGDMTVIPVVAWALIEITEFIVGEGPETDTRVEALVSGTRNRITPISEWVEPSIVQSWMYFGPHYDFSQGDDSG